MMQQQVPDLVPPEATDAEHPSGFGKILSSTLPWYIKVFQQPTLLQPTVELGALPDGQIRMEEDQEIVLVPLVVDCFGIPRHGTVYFQKVIDIGKNDSGTV